MKTLRKRESRAGMDDNKRWSDNVEEIRYKDRVDNIATKILVHHDYESSKETKIFWTM